MNQNNRKCIVSNKVLNKNELIRIVKTKDKKFYVNSDKSGRGAYVFNEKNSIKEVIKKKLLHKAFKMDVPKEVYDELEKIIKE
jgi:predicted RNA-binding protein YlxR (DUF448 family)